MPVLAGGGGGEVEPAPERQKMLGLHFFNCYTDVYAKKFKFCFKNGLTKDFSNPFRQRKTITGLQKRDLSKTSCTVGFFIMVLKGIDQ